MSDYVPAETAQPQPQDQPVTLDATVTVTPSLPTTLAYTNAYALVSILTVFLQPIVGIVFGHLALGQIKRNGDAGRGLALTGLIIGYVIIAFVILMMIFYITMVGLMLAGIGGLMSDFGSDFSYDDPYEW